MNLSRYLTVLPVLIATTVFAAQSDLTADEMRTAEDTLRDLDSNISLQNRKALDEARELARFFQQVGAHYTAQSDAARGVDFARKSQAHAEAIATAVEAGDYDTAQDRLSDLTRSCKTCHEVYKTKK
ncbi:hypothetical protein ACS5PN_30170 [Roseateles sp. NT4]|uniref:hypothetical protein n=1 Tax=Roseateles sp. NT4 TaxID=3453715 RepID=UPI003EE9141B